eukprot:TRINITY_DN14373_c0_g1_i1.p1 TRINITY_DN14373_c0_g1~~TRINITY_DN14373_c0_g1_i1.p1  ORF type:complete len:618 (-),score=120.14 TRINITY_DN14373_c0_g1_i1:25-1857(-)
MFSNEEFPALGGDVQAQPRKSTVAWAVAGPPPVAAPAPPPVPTAPSDAEAPVKTVVAPKLAALLAKRAESELSDAATKTKKKRKKPRKSAASAGQLSGTEAGPPAAPPQPTSMKPKASKSIALSDLFSDLNLEAARMQTTLRLEKKQKESNPHSVLSELSEIIDAIVVQPDRVSLRTFAAHEQKIVDIMQLPIAAKLFQQAGFCLRSGMYCLEGSVEHLPDLQLAITNRIHQLDKATANPVTSELLHGRRGKERRGPKKQRPTRMKKIICSEREGREKKEGEGKASCDDRTATDKDEHRPETGGETEDCTETEMETDAEPQAPNHTIHRYGAHPLAYFMEQRSAYVNQLIAHRPIIREYCASILTDEADKLVGEMCGLLVPLQKRLLGDEYKLRKLKRYVNGIRQTQKGLLARRVKMVLIAPNIEKIVTEGGLDTMVDRVLALCTEQNVPVIFCLNRAKLGQAIHVRKASAIGIYSAEGAHPPFKLLGSIAEQSRKAFSELIKNKDERLAELEQIVASQAKKPKPQPQLQPQEKQTKPAQRQAHPAGAAPRGKPHRRQYGAAAYSRVAFENSYENYYYGAPAYYQPVAGYYGADGCFYPSAAAVEPQMYQ